MRYIISCISIFYCSLLFSQNTNFEDVEILYKSENGGGLIVHTAGWGVNYFLARNLSAFNKRLWSFDYIGLKHPKETKSYNQYSDNSQGYVYGKLNNAGLLRMALGFQHVLVQRQKRKGVEISYKNLLGVTLAFLKPYYLNVRDEESTFIFPTYSNKQFNQDISQTDIHGKSNFFIGLDEVKVHPALGYKFGLNFEYGGEKEQIKSIEVGTIIDIFANKLPIMYGDVNKWLNVNLYANIMIGTRKIE